MFSQVVGVTNVQPREQCHAPPLRLRLERPNPLQDPLLHVINQLVVFPVGIRQTKVCNPFGMEVVDEVADLFVQESQQSVILRLTRGKFVRKQQGLHLSPSAMLPAVFRLRFSSLLREARSSLLLPFLNRRGPGKEYNSEKRNDCNPA